MLESIPATQGFEGEWGLVANTHEQWKEVLHVDDWCDAQHVQRQGTTAENELLVMSRKDGGRRIWPVAVSAARQQSVGSSNAVKAVNDCFPRSGTGFDVTRGMTAAYKGPSETRTSLLAAAQSFGNLDPGRALHRRLLLRLLRMQGHPQCRHLRFRLLL